MALMRMVKIRRSGVANDANDDERTNMVVAKFAMTRRVAV